MTQTGWLPTKLFRRGYINCDFDAVTAVVHDEIARFMRAFNLTEEHVGPHEGFRGWRIGIEAGPATMVDALAHEWAHIAQLKPQETARVYENGFAFHIPYNDQLDCYDPYVMKRPWDLIREAEVMGIETLALHHVFPNLDVQKHLKSCLESARFLPSWTDSRREWFLGRMSRVYTAGDLARHVQSFWSNWAAIQCRRHEKEKHERQQQQQSTVLGGDPGTHPPGQYRLDCDVPASGAENRR